MAYMLSRAKKEYTPPGVLTNIRAVQGHRRSMILVPIGSTHATFY